MNKRTVAGVTAGLLALILGGASFAWACTRQAKIRVTPPTTTAGETVQVSGESFIFNAPVKIHWNSADGPVLAETRGANFAIDVVIPATASDGHYYIVAVGYKDALATQVAGRAAAVVEVGDPSAEAAPPPAQTYTSGTGQNSGSRSGGSPDQTTREDKRLVSESAGRPRTEGSGETFGTESAGDAEDAAVAGPEEEAAVRTFASGAQADRGSDGQAVRREVTAPARIEAVRQATTPGLGRSAIASTASGQRVFAGSVAPDTSQRGGDRSSDGVSAGSDVAAPELAAAGDLWSGFASDTASSLVPSLAGTGQTAGVQQNQFVAGLSLVAAGLVLLSGGALVAQQRRRRIARRA